jgi:predicted transcriptional regulator
MPQKELLKKAISGKVISGLIHEKRLTQAQVAKDLKESEQLISNYAKGKRAISAEFANKWEKMYGERLIDLIDLSLMKSTDVDENITPAMNSSNKQTDLAAMAAAFRETLEAYTEYTLIPKSLLDNHRLISKEQMDKDERTLNKLLDFIEQQRIEISNLRSQIAVVEKGQKNA